MVTVRKKISTAPDLQLVRKKSQSGSSSCKIFMLASRISYTHRWQKIIVLRQALSFIERSLTKYAFMTDIHVCFYCQVDI